MTLRTRTLSVLILALAATAAAAQSGVPTQSERNLPRARPQGLFDPDRPTALSQDRERGAHQAGGGLGEILRGGPQSVHADRPDGRRGELCAAADLPRAAARSCGRTIRAQPDGKPPGGRAADADPSGRSAWPIACYERSSRTSLTCAFHCDMLSAMIFTEVIATWLNCA